MFSKKNILNLITLLFLGFTPFEGQSQLINYDLRVLRKEWGYWDFVKANSARFSFYMGRQQKRTILYMNLARQNGEKFQKLVVDPYIEKNPDKEGLHVKLRNTNMHELNPSFRLWLAALPHAIVSGIVGSEGHQFFEFRTLFFLNLNSTLGENCSYGYYRGIDVTIQLLNSPPHRTNILNEDFSRAAVSKAPHLNYGWNSVTVFSGPKFTDHVFRGHYKHRHFQANIALATDFNQAIVDMTVGIRYQRDVNAARWALGAEIFPQIANTLFVPKIHFSNEYYYFGFGGNFLAFMTSSASVIIARPEVSLRVPFSINKNYYTLFDLEKSKTSIGISYGYNFPLYVKGENPLNAHQLTFTYTKNFGFVEKR